MPSGARITLDDPSARPGHTEPVAGGTPPEPAAAGPGDSTADTQVYEWPDGTADSPIHDAVVGAPAASRTASAARPVSGAPPSWPPATPTGRAATETVESSPGWPAASPGPVDGPATTATGWPDDAATTGTGGDTAAIGIGRDTGPTGRDTDSTGTGRDTGPLDSGPLDTRPTVNLAGRVEPRGSDEPWEAVEPGGDPEPAESAGPGDASALSSDGLAPLIRGSATSSGASATSSGGSAPSGAEDGGGGDGSAHSGGDEAEPGPETTAVIEVGPTVDLADRLPDKAEPGSQ